eukprot:g6518.t1
MDLMFLADKADQEATKEANRLQDMQRAPSHSEEGMFDNRVDQRRVWMAKNEVALQSRLRYQEAVEALHRVQAAWGPLLGVEVCVGTSPRTASSKSSGHTRAASSTGGGGEDMHDTATTGNATGGTTAAVHNEVICLWVIGVITVNVTGETLGRAYYGSFSEATTVPSCGWTAFDEGSGQISVSCVVPKKVMHKRKQPGVDTWVVDGASFPEVNGRYMERGVYDGVPRYRNPNNIYLFRHTLGRSEELGITRQTCLPESELAGEDVESAATTAALSLGREVSGKIGMDFSRLVKTSLQSINLDRQERVRLNHQRIARAVARVDSQFQEQMSQASATLDGVDRAESGEGGGGGSVVSSLGGGGEKNREMAVMAASDSAKLTFQERTSDEDRVISCEEHGAAPLCKRWVARACPKNQIQCRCRHYFISIAERDRMVAWRESKRSRAELEVLACIAKRETLLFEAEKEGVACSRRFLSETRTEVDEGDVSGLLSLLDQLRLASVRVVEAVCLWREDVQATRMTSSPSTMPHNPPSTGAGTATGRYGGDKGATPVGTSVDENGEEGLPGTALPQQQPGGEDGVATGVVGDSASHSDIDQAKGLDDEISNIGKTHKRPGGPSGGSAGGGGEGGGGSGSRRGEGNHTEAGGGEGRGVKGRWVATMMVPGRKLWDSSPAMLSQYKRFRRSRQDPKIARDQLCLGVFATKNEAIEAYDDALCREAVKQRSSVLRMPKKRIVTRTCGKHMAVQSDDTPAGRPCEQCAAEALNGGVKHSPPYIWNNSNYLLKMTEDLKFLAEVDPLVTWLGAGDSRASGGGGEAGTFDLKDNPFLLADPDEDEDEYGTEESQENRSPDSNALSTATTGRNTPPATLPINHSAANNRTAAPPSTALPSLPGPPSHRETTKAGVALVLPTSPQQQQRLRVSSGSTSPDSSIQNSYVDNDNDDDKTAARASCSISAVTIPRAAWAEEGDSIIDDSVFGGSTMSDNLSSDAPGSPGFPDGAKPILGNNGWVNGSAMVPTTADMMFHGEERCTDRLGGSRGLGASAGQQPRRAAFGKPSTQVTRFSNGVQEWHGETAKGGRFILPFTPSSLAGYSSVNHMSNNANNQEAESHRPKLVPEGVGPGFPSRQDEGTCIEVLDLKRVEAALAILHEEEDIADAMSGKPPRGRCTSTKRGVIHDQRVDTAVVGTPAGSVDKRAEINSSAPAGVRPDGMNETRKAQATEVGRAATAGDGKVTRAVGVTAVGVASNRKRMRNVMAVYRHRGAQLVLEQTRKRHPFRMDGVFCRQDRGEWAGQVHMSVNAKKFVARRLLDKVLERRNEQRGRIGRMMHKLIEQGQPIHRLAGPRLRALLSKARDLGGDRLSIDIMEAEAVLRVFGRVEKSATVIQAFVRGVFGREASKRFVAMRRKEARLRRITMTAAGEVAEEVVKDVLQNASRRARRAIRRPVTASVGVFQDGRKMIVSAVPLEQRSVAGGAPKVTTEWTQLCSACQGRSAQRVWSCKNNSEEIFRGVCSCTTARPPESVRLTAHDPVTGEQVYMTISGKHLAKYLLNKRATAGVDGQPTTSLSGYIDVTSPAAREHVIAAARLLPLPWDAALGYGNPKREAGMIQRRFWEPYDEARKVQKMAEEAKMDQLQLREASLVAEEAAAKAASIAEAARALHETWLMNAEHVAGRRRDLVLKFLSECEKSREALAFSRNSVQQMEDRDAEDWTQGWDPFENGNNWRQLIKRRATDRALTASTQAGLFARDAVYRAREERAASKHWAKEARAKAERAKTALEKGTALADALHKQAEEARSAASEALKLLALLSRPTVKAAGRLQKRLVIEEGGHDRHQWDALFRGGMVLETPELSYVSAQEKKRRFCVATIRRDARTGTVIVTAAGEDKAIDLYSVTMSAAEVMSVVSEKVGGRRGKELVSPIVMEGAYAAICRVQDARRKEILQVFVESLKLDIYQNELAIGKLFFLRRSVELKSRLLESLWHRDAVARRSSGRGTEILRQFHRLGTGWAAVTVYETWGDLFFEAYDPVTASTMSLQTSLREVLESLSLDRAATAAFLHAVRTGTFPRKLVRQLLNRLDVNLPGERGKWWRRPIDGEMPHLVLLRGGTSHGGGRNTCQQYRGPIWTEERFSSGKPVTARVFVSASGDYLVEMEARDPKKQAQHQGVGGVEHELASSGSSVFNGRTSARGVLHLELRASELRVVFRGLEKRQQGQEGSLERLLAPDFRVELCRYLLEHIALEEAHPTTNTGGGNPAGNGSTQQQTGTIPEEAEGSTGEANRRVDVELQEAYKSYQAWAAAVNAPVDPDPLRGMQLPTQTHERQHSTDAMVPLLSPSEFLLVLRPDISSDEHLLPIHESPWTPDGKVWFQAKISLLQDDASSAVIAAPAGRESDTGGLGAPHREEQRRRGSDDKNIWDQELGGSAGLSVTLRPEGVGQRRVRLEREATEAMALEDERSRQVCEGKSKLEKQAAGRARVVDERNRAATLATAVFTAKTRTHNRVKALMQEEHSLAEKWAEQDLRSAQETAQEIFPLLRLEASQSGDGGRGAGPVLRIMDTNADEGVCGSHFQGRFHVLDNPVEHEQTTTTTASPAARNNSRLFGFRPSFAIPAAARSGTGETTEDQTAEKGQGSVAGTAMRHEVEPAPLRASFFQDGLPEGVGLLVPFERRYRGEGFLERRRPGLGPKSHGAATIKRDEERRQSPDQSRPKPLAQQVLRLEGSGAAGGRMGSSSESVVAVVRAVLEPPPTETCDCDRALHTDKGNQGGGKDLSLQSNLGLCEVRGVVRVEAYLPSSSTTLKLRVKVPVAATAFTPGVEGSAETQTRGRGTADNDSVPPLRVTVSTTRGDDSAAAPARADRDCTVDAGRGRGCEKQFHTLANAGHEEECRSRKHQRRMLIGARETEAKRGAVEMIAAVQEATAHIARSSAGAATQQRPSLGSNKSADDSEPKQNNAFSMLLVRANVVVPIKRLNQLSGSWREAIGELVGCPPGQELRALNVNGPLVFALHSSCPATFNVKAQKLLGISVQGDVVWVQARAEERVLQLLEADRQLTGQEGEAAIQLGSDQEEKAEIEERRSRRYDEAVKKEARRLLPALSRSFFSAPVNSEDKAAAEVRSLLNRAWLSSTSDLFSDPLKGVSGPDLVSGSSLAVATSTASAGSPNVALNYSMTQVQLRPWHVAKDLLKMHVLACKVPGPACPVPCCQQCRARTSDQLDDDDEATVASAQGNADAGGGANAVLLRELDRCIMWYWESKEHRRRGARKDHADQSKIDPVNDDDGEEEDNEKRKGSKPPITAAKPRRKTAAWGVGSERAKHPEKSQPQHRSSPRPFQQALQALNRLTAASGKPHDGVLKAVSSFSSTSSVNNGCGRIGREVGQTKPSHAPCRLSTLNTDGSTSGRRGSVGGGGGGGGGAESSSSEGERCRIEFEIIRLLTGPDGKDAGGSPVGVSRWVMSRLRMNTRGGQTNIEDKEEHRHEVLGLDERHSTGAVCISGTRFLLTISQLLDGSLFVAGHDPITCQTATLTLDEPAANTMCLSEGLQVGSTGRTIGSVIAKHVMRNAGRLLEVQTVGGVDTLAVADYNRADNESLASSTSSGAMMPGGFGKEPRTGSPRQPQQVGQAGDNSNGGKADASSSEGLLHETPSMAGGETELMECRIRRLEGGRRRAESARRVASSRRVARVGEERRKMVLTGDADALALSKSSFEALLLIAQGTAHASSKDGSPPAAAGLEKAHILALRNRVVLELTEGDSNGLPQRRRGSVEVIVETVRRGSIQLRRGSVQLMAEVKERTLKRPVSSAGKSDRNHDNQPFSHTSADDENGDEENTLEATPQEDDAVLSSLVTEDDADAPALSNISKRDEAHGRM